VEIIKVRGRPDIRAGNNKMWSGCEIMCTTELEAKNWKAALESVGNDHRAVVEANEKKKLLLKKNSQIEK